MKRVIILGQARSGSTLVQRVLNTVPNSYVAGENKNFWYHIFQAYKAWEYIPTWEVKLAENKGVEPFSYNTKTDAYKPCWWNENYKQNSFIIKDEIHYLMSVIYNYEFKHPELIGLIGFKEIRFPQDVKEFNEYLDWWRMLFPDIYFVFTVRNIKTIVKSGWHKPSDKERLLNEENLLRSRIDGFLVEYENPDWKGLFNHLGLEYNENEVQRILNKKL